MIAHDRRIAENTASDRQRLYENTSAIGLSLAIIWKHFSAIVSDYMEIFFSDRRTVGDRERSYASVIPAIRRS